MSEMRSSSTDARADLRFEWIVASGHRRCTLFETLTCPGGIDEYAPIRFQSARDRDGSLIVGGPRTTSSSGSATRRKRCRLPRAGRRSIRQTSRALAHDGQERRTHSGASRLRSMRSCGRSVEDQCTDSVCRARPRCQRSIGRHLCSARRRGVRGWGPVHGINAVSLRVHIYRRGRVPGRELRVVLNGDDRTQLVRRVYWWNDDLRYCSWDQLGWLRKRRVHPV